ncbi:hypothetical protein B0J11DRAFT_129394 [Dendryphion nanum]|uniref:Uncharacterized protein n=1 Tax=Dendryphion nanum TaxID=256645 RepID=A0A9P9DAB9_9PLEO|nr:hypothetical protein B0J11DRAFT_129394 [Dendryphion nanum]
MAPKGGKGGSSGGGRGGSVSACPGAFSGIYGTRVEYFVIWVLHWVALLAILIVWPRIRKNNPKTKRLVGPFFGIGLVLNLFAMTMQLIMIVLWECQSTDENDYYNVAIAYSIFFRIAYYFLLIVVVWGVNVILRDRLGGAYPVVYKFVINGLLTFMGLLTVAFIGLQSYNLFSSTDAGSGYRLSMQTAQFILAYWVLYMVTLIVGSALALVTITQLRTRPPALGSAFGFIIALFISSIIWVVFLIVAYGVSISFSPTTYIQPEGFIAFEYITVIFMTVSYVLVLLVAKNDIWKIPLGTVSYVVGQNYAPVPQHKAEYSTAPQVAPQYNSAPQVVPQQQQAPQSVPQQQNHQATQQYAYPQGQVPMQHQQQQQAPQQFYYPQPPPQQQQHYNQPELVQGHQTR